MVHLLDKLPDAYNKSPQSNIYKLLKIASDQLANGEATLQLINEWRDIDQAQGVTLDKLGKDVGQPRGGMDDEPYRKAIKIKIRANLSGGEIETLNSIAVVLLSDRFDGVQEGWNLPQNHPLSQAPAMLLFTVKADGIHYGLPIAEMDSIRSGGVAANWELLIDRQLDISQVDYEHVSAPYEMVNQVTASTEQQKGPINLSTIETASTYTPGMSDMRMAGGNEQQQGPFYYPHIEASSRYLAGLHTLQMAGMVKTGEVNI